MLFSCLQTSRSRNSSNINQTTGQAQPYHLHHSSPACIAAIQVPTSAMDKLFQSICTPLNQHTQLIQSKCTIPVHHAQLHSKCTTSIMDKLFQAIYTISDQHAQLIQPKCTIPVPHAQLCHTFSTTPVQYAQLQSKCTPDQNEPIQPKCTTSSPHRIIQSSSGQRKLILLSLCKSIQLQSNCTTKLRQQSNSKTEEKKDGYIRDLECFQECIQIHGGNQVCWESVINAWSKEMNRLCFSVF